MSTAPPVIVRAPADLGPVELCVRHEDWAVEVDVRPAGTTRTWTPIALMGGAFEVRTGEAPQPPAGVYVEDDAEDTPTVWLHRPDDPERPIALLTPGNLGRHGRELLWAHIVRGLPTSPPAAA